MCVGVGEFIVMWVAVGWGGALLYGKISLYAGGGHFCMGKFLYASFTGGTGHNRTHRQISPPETSLISLNVRAPGSTK